MGGTGKKNVTAANRNKAQEKKVQEQQRLEREKKAAQLKAAADSGKNFQEEERKKQTALSAKVKDVDPASLVTDNTIDINE